MKTKIRTFIGLVALGIIGFTNLNATAANNEMDTLVTVEAKENLVVEAWMQNSNLWIDNAETKTEKVATEKAPEVEVGLTDEDFLKAAESYTAAGSEKEVEKYANKQIALENEREGK